MNRRSPSHALVLLLVFVLSAAPAFAGSRTTLPSPAETLWTAIVRLWQGLETLVPTAKAHGTMDPDGSPTTPNSIPPAGSETDAHGTMDPNG